MKILILSTSPRKSFSTSLYFSKLLKLFLLGHQVEIILLKTIQDYNTIIGKLNDIDKLIFVTPVYVDSIPSTTLDYLKKLEIYIRENRLNFNVYAILNCGFYEGHQCSLALNTYKLWCKKAGVTWCEGIGIGSGVMLGFIRLLPFIRLIIIIPQIVIFAINQNLSSSKILWTIIINIIIQILLWFLFSMGAFIHIFRLAKSIRKNRIHGNKFTTVWFCPRFLFVIMASLYWVFRALILHLTMPWKLFEKNE